MRPLASILFAETRIASAWSIYEMFGLSFDTVSTSGASVASTVQIEPKMSPPTPFSDVPDAMSIASLTMRRWKSSKNGPLPWRTTLSAWLMCIA